MKILHLIYDDPENRWCGGGGAVRAFEINRRLAKDNEITVITGNAPELKNETIDNVEFIRIGSSKNYLISRITYTLFAPYYMRKFDSDIVINDFSVFSPVFCELFTSKPVINLLHHFVGKHAFKKYSIFGILPYLAEKIIFKISKRFLTVSPSNAEILEKKVGKKEKIRYICNGISEDLFCSEIRNGDYIAFLGRIDIYMKGLDVLLEAYSKLENKTVKLKIAGTGKQKDVEILKKRILKLKLQERVEYLGVLEEREKREYLLNSMFVVMPSRFEGWGIVAVEAQACGKAVIGTNIPGLRDAIKGGETGILIDIDDVNSLKKAMDDLITDRDSRESYGRRGKEWAKSFKWDNVAEEQSNFYISVLEKGS